MAKVVRLPVASAAAAAPQWIRVDRLMAHPDNPRLVERSDVIDAIAAALSSGFDPAHALIVRPLADGWQIISGHHRKAAAERARLDEIPCWVREFDDTEAYLMLVTCNAQSELSPLERGIHALRATEKGKHGLSIAAYAARVGRPHQSVNRETNAAEVFYEAAEAHMAAFDGPPEEQSDFLERLHERSCSLTSNFTEIHRAPRHEWPALVKGMIDGDWNIEETRAEVRAVNRHTPPAEELPRIRNDRTALDHVSLAHWHKMSKAAQKALLQPSLDSRGAPSFNKQAGSDIEWAMYSFNVITGCEHTCPYCYARQIANSPAVAHVYPFGFAPTLHPRRLLAPRAMKVPPEAESDGRYRNVFLGSMADMFGRWVPREWIDAVLAMVAASPEWNFLCLTKFPKRMAEFDIPANAWMGTTVDLQARVAAAETAFANVGAAVRWLSCEPLIEPLRFKHLDRFDWIVIGGASRTDTTPEWQPPFEWIADLVRQARDAGLKVYFKTNLLQGWQWDRPLAARRIIELPFDAPIPAMPTKAPEIFHYLRAAPE